MSSIVPCPLNGVLLDGVCVDGADHLGVVAGVDHGVAGDVGNAKKNF
jgi:hypothetical protein